MKFIELYLSTIIMWIVFYKIGKILFENKNKPIWLIIVVILLFSAVVSFINCYGVDMIYTIIKILIVYFLMLLFNKILFGNNDNDKIILGSLIIFLIYVLSEGLVAIILSVIIKLTSDSSLMFLRNKLISNILIAAIAYVITSINRNKMASIIKETKNNKSNIIITVLLILTAILLLVRIPINEWIFGFEFIITMIILIGLSIVGLILMKQKTDIQKTKEMYQQLVDYSNITNGLLEDYRTISHERKNQLLIIRSMLDNSDNNELIEYVEELLDKQVENKYPWISELNYLPLSGVKGLINYKLIEANDLNMNTNILVSKDIIKSKLDKLTMKQKSELYSIVGVYLDNAIDASKNSERKELSLEIYKEKSKVIIVIANTYNEGIDLDKIDNYGYTTKGKNHGVGLHLVKKIIDNELIFSQCREIFEDYYIQKLIIDLSKISNKKTT